MNNTQEAIVFGQSMNEEMKNEMIRGQKMYHAKSIQLRSEGKFQEGMDIAFKAQLCREAVEAFNGTLKLRGQK